MRLCWLYAFILFTATSTPVVAKPAVDPVTSFTGKGMNAVATAANQMFAELYLAPQQKVLGYRINKFESEWADTLKRLLASATSSQSRCHLKTKSWRSVNESVSQLSLNQNPTISQTPQLKNFRRMVNTIIQYVKPLRLYQINRHNAHGFGGIAIADTQHAEVLIVVTGGTSSSVSKID